MLRIRLKRAGGRNHPFYRVVVIDSRRARDSRAVEEIGYYNPIEDPLVVNVDRERVSYWTERGAQVSSAVRGLLKRENTEHPTRRILEEFTPEPVEEAPPKSKKKAKAKKEAEGEGTAEGDAEKPVKKTKKKAAAKKKVAAKKKDDTAKADEPAAKAEAKADEPAAKAEAKTDKTQAKPEAKTKSKAKTESQEPKADAKAGDQPKPKPDAAPAGETKDESAEVK